MKIRIAALVISFVFLLGCASSKTEKNINCCAGIGLDITNITGKAGIDCGNINMWPFPANKRAGRERAKHRSLACVKEAELKGIPFMVTYKTTLPPDVSYSETYILTELGESILLYMGEQGDSGFEVGVSKCESIKLEPDGKLKASKCSLSDEIFEKLKAKH